MMSKGGLLMSKNNDKFTRDGETRFTLRINTDLLEKIKEQAYKNKRSTAKEIEIILESFFQDKN